MKLVKLIIVSRHGQRTPIHCTKEDKEYFKQNVQLLQNPETQVLNAHWVFEVQGALKLPHKLDREDDEE